MNTANEPSWFFAILCNTVKPYFKYNIHICAMMYFKPISCQVDHLLHDRGFLHHSNTPYRLGRCFPTISHCSNVPSQNSLFYSCNLTAGSLFLILPHHANCNHGPSLWAFPRNPGVTSFFNMHFLTHIFGCLQLTDPWSSNSGFT